MSTAEANSLLQQAQKAATSKGWFGLGGPKYDEAAELFSRAGNSFKLAKKWQEAGEAYLKSAQMYIQAGEEEDASTAYLAAAKCFKKGYPTEAIQSLQCAIKILKSKGRLYPAAAQQKEIAQIYENEFMDIENAMNAYEEAAEWYESEDSKAQATNCSLKVATMAAELEQYQKAYEIFERVAQASLDNQLTKWSVKDYLLKAGICRLAVDDHVATQRAFEHYQDMDVAFGSTRECKLLLNLAQAIEAGDQEAFTTHVFEYDQMTKLDKWKTTILLRVKQAISSESDLT
ncbi:vesicular-fusion protein S17 [Dispira simplex]|nr:vesicular-fusion protein S17 [Dispira simplex]